MVGRNIGNYQITDELAQGDKGIVYRGRHADLPREVVVREIPLAPFPVSTRVQLKARFRRETFIQAQLSHQSIVRVYESFAIGDNYYIVQEYVPGVSLRDLLRRQGLPTTPQALYLCKQALAALDYAHTYKHLDESDTQRSGVIHRDIKPSNILVDYAGRLKLTDFGIVRLPDKQSLAPPSFQPGTAEYMPPEQLRGMDLDARSDIYSLGVTFYEMMTGQLPFMRTSNGAGDEAIRPAFDGPPLAIHELRNDVNPALAAIFMRSIFRSPSERFQSAAEFLKAIKEYERSVGASESPSNPLMAKTPPLLRGDVTIIELGNAAKQPAPQRPMPQSPEPAISRPVTKTPSEIDRELPAAAARSKTSDSLAENSLVERAVSNSKALVRNPLNGFPPNGDSDSQVLFSSLSDKGSSSAKIVAAAAAAALLLIGLAGGAIYLNRASDQSAPAAAANDSRPEPSISTVNAATPEPAQPQSFSGDLNKLDEAREADKQGKFNQAALLYEEYLRSGADAAGAAEVSAQLERLKKFIAYLNSAKYAYGQGDYASARRNYSEALKLRPYSRMVQNGLASSQARLAGKTRAPDGGATRPRRVEAAPPPPTPDSRL